MLGTEAVKYCFALQTDGTDCRLPKGLSEMVFMVASLVNEHCSVSTGANKHLLNTISQLITYLALLIILSTAQIQDFQLNHYKPGRKLQ